MVVLPLHGFQKVLKYIESVSKTYGNLYYEENAYISKFLCSKINFILFFQSNQFGSFIVQCIGLFLHISLHIFIKGSISNSDLEIGCALANSNS